MGIRGTRPNVSGLVGTRPVPHSISMALSGAELVGAGAATGTGTAFSPSASVQAAALLASGTGSAFDAAALGTTPSDALAIAATGTGSALDAKISLAPNAALGSGTGVAGAASASVRATAGLATGAGTAGNLPITVIIPSAVITFSAPSPRGFSVDRISDFRVFLFPHGPLEVDATGWVEWEVHIETSMGQPSTSSFTLQDRGTTGLDFPILDIISGLGITLEKMDIEIVLVGQEMPLFRGQLLNDKVELPEFFPWRFHDVSATSYQRDLFQTRYIGTPGGSQWEGPDRDGTYHPVDGRVYLSGSDKSIIQNLFAAVGYIASPFSPIDASTHVYQYTPFVDPYVGSVESPQPPDRMTIGGVLDLMSGLAIDNVQDWLDQALRVHHVAIPRWWENVAPSFGVGGPNPPPPPGITASILPQAPANIDNDNPDPDGDPPSIGARHLGWSFDYTSVVGQFYVTGGVGYAYNGGLVVLNGSGWVTFDINGEVGTEVGPSEAYPMALLNANDAIDTTTKLAAAGRAAKSVSRGTLRGHCTVGNERHHPDGWDVGQLIKITDARMPDILNGRYYVIQRVSLDLIPTENIRIYNLEWGDAPTQRASSRGRDTSTRENENNVLPGRLYDIATRNQQPLPGSTVTVVGQLTDEAGREKRVAGVSVPLELHVWDSAGVVVLGVGSITPTTTTTDAMGRWWTNLTVGLQAGYYYCICPEDSGSCVLELP